MGLLQRGQVIHMYQCGVVFKHTVLQRLLRSNGRINVNLDPVDRGLCNILISKRLAPSHLACSTAVGGRLGDNHFRCSPTLLHCVFEAGLLQGKRDPAPSQSHVLARPKVISILEGSLPSTLIYMCEETIGLNALTALLGLGPRVAP